MSLQFTFTPGKRVDSLLLYTIHEKQLYKMKGNFKYQCYFQGCKVRVKITDNGLCWKMLNCGEHVHANQEFEMQQMKRLDSAKVALQNTKRKGAVSLAVKDENEIAGQDEKIRFPRSNHEIQLLQQDQKIRSLQKELNALKEANNCVVCLSLPRTIAIVPCGHYCTCVNCTHILTNQQIPKCPMCRGVIQKTQSIFS